MDTENSKTLAQILASLDETNRLVKEIRSVAGPFGVMFPDGSMLVQTIYGNKYFIDPNDLVMAPQLVVYRQWEADLSRYMLNSTTKDTAFVDVGANFGYFTCLVGSKIGKSGSGKVIAIEANPNIYRLLKKNVKVNWSMCPIFTFDIAVSDTEGEIRFHIPRDGAANASIANSARKSAVDEIVVRSKTLDAITHKGPVDIMKIDVEGFETAVLNGAHDVINRSPDINIILEWSPEQTKSAGYSAEGLISIFEKHGLQAYKLPHSRFIGEADWDQLHISRESLKSFGYDNICLRRRMG